MSEEVPRQSVEYSDNEQEQIQRESVISNENNEKQPERNDPEPQEQEERGEEIAVENNLNSLGAELAGVDNVNESIQEEKL